MDAEDPSRDPRDVLKKTSSSEVNDRVHSHRRGEKARLSGAGGGGGGGVMTPGSGASWFTRSPARPPVRPGVPGGGGTSCVGAHVRVFVDFPKLRALTW